MPTAPGQDRTESPADYSRRSTGGIYGGVARSRPVGDRAHSAQRFIRCMRRRLALSGSDAVTQINGSGFWLPGQMNTNEFSDPKESPQNLSSGGKVSLSFTLYQVPT